MALLFFSALPVRWEVFLCEAFSCNNLLCHTKSVRASVYPYAHSLSPHGQRTWGHLVSSCDRQWPGTLLWGENATANFTSHSWRTRRIVLLSCRQPGHTANIPFPLCAAAEESIAAPRRSCSTSLLCLPSKETAIETHDHEAFEFCSLLLLALGLHDRVTLKTHNQGRACPRWQPGPLFAAQRPCAKLSKRYFSFLPPQGCFAAPAASDTSGSICFCFPVEAEVPVVVLLWC